VDDYSAFTLFRLQFNTMELPSTGEIASLITIFFALCGALIAAFWLSLVIWAFRDMRRRSRDPFAQIMAALLVAVLPFVGALVYLILRPPETLAERYERALEEEALLQDIEERPRCPNCERTADPRWQICAYCQEPLKKRCVACAETLERSWTHCPFCTTAQPTTRTPVETTPDEPVIVPDSAETPTQS
jgi:hypothetical protein